MDVVDRRRLEELDRGYRVVTQRFFGDETSKKGVSSSRRKPHTALRRHRLYHVFLFSFLTDRQTRPRVRSGHETDKTAMRGRGILCRPAANIVFFLNLAMSNSKSKQYKNHKI